MEKIYFIFAALCGTLLASCSTEDASIGNPEAMIQFNPGNLLAHGVISRSSMFFFMDDNVQVDTIWFDVLSVLKVPDRTMYIKLEQFDEIIYDYVYNEKGALIDSVANPVPNQAVPGRHYVAFDNAEYSKLVKIEAGQFSTRIPVVTLRHESEKENTYYLNFRIVDSPDLKVAGSKAISAKIAISDKVSKPSAWNDQFYIFGNYGEVKHGFMIRVTGQKWDNDFVAMISLSQSDQVYYRQVLRAALAEENAERASQGLAPLAEADGTPVEFPAS